MNEQRPTIVLREDPAPDAPGRALWRHLPLFTGPLDSLGILTLHRGLGHGLFMVGDWPNRVAFSVPMLDKAAILTLVGDTIVVVCANGHAEYRAVGRVVDGDVVVADLGHWLIDRAVSDA